MVRMWYLAIPVVRANKRENDLGIAINFAARGCGMCVQVDLKEAA